MRQLNIVEGTVYTTMLLLNSVGESYGERDVEPLYARYIGDVNPFEHGGTIYIEDDGEEGEITSIRFVSFMPADEGLHVSDGIIDIMDSWIDLVKVAEYAVLPVVLTDKQSLYENRFEIANALISYYDVQNFGGEWEAHTEESAREMLKEFYDYSITFSI